MYTPLLDYSINLISCQGMLYTNKYALLLGFAISIFLMFLLALNDFGYIKNKSKLYNKYIKLIIITTISFFICLILNYLFIISCH